MFSVDKNKKIEKIYETTDNKKHSVSYNFAVVLEAIKYNNEKDKNIIGFFEVHNHPNYDDWVNRMYSKEEILSEQDKKNDKENKQRFKQEFGNTLFFDNFVFFQWHKFGDYKHYLNNVNDIFNKEILVKCC